VFLKPPNAQWQTNAQSITDGPGSTPRPFLFGEHLERLIISPDSKYPGKFSASLESCKQVIVERSRQPLVDGARKLLELDFCPSATLTMRHLEKTYDSTLPRPIGDLAKETYTEGERTTLRASRWVPFNGVRYARTEVPV
jgi:hypothetical protein